MRSLGVVCLLGSLLLTTAVVMAAAPGSVPFDISTPQSFHEQAAQMRAGLNPGGTYASLSTRKRARVESAISAMTALFWRYGNIEAMGGAKRVELYNAQESVNRILTHGRTGAIHCAWAQQTGSHIPRTLCWSTQT